MQLNIVYTNEYPPELAGERVGWVSVSDQDGLQPSVVVNVVAATVGSEGAKHGYHKRDGEPERLYSSNSDEGFIAVSGLSVLISRKHGIDQSGIFYRAGEQRGEGSSILQSGASGFTTDEEDRDWAEVVSS